MVRGLLVPADVESPVRPFEFSSPESYISAVRGWYDSVDVPPLGITMHVNDEGRLRQLPLNSRATFLWWYELPHVRQGAMLYGDAVIVGLPGEHGEATDIPPATLALLYTREPYGVVVRYRDVPRWVKHPFPYADYFDAVVWAMILAEHETSAQSVRVVTMNQLEDLDRHGIEGENGPSPWLF